MAEEINELNVHITTGNVGNKPPPDDLSGLCPRGGGDFDIIVVRKKSVFVGNFTLLF